MAEGFSSIHWVWLLKIEDLLRDQLVLASDKGFKEWLEQAMHAQDKRDIPKAQKKQRINKSLRGLTSELETQPGRLRSL